MTKAKPKSGRAQRAIVKDSTRANRRKRIARHLKMHGEDGQAVRAFQAHGGDLGAL